MNFQVKRLLTIFFGVTIAALGVRLFVFENYRVVSESMFPNLLEGDFVGVSKFNFNVHVPFSAFELLRLRRPERSEIVMYTVPDHGMASYVQRVVAVEGDRVEIREGILLINGKAARYESEEGSDEIFLEQFPDQPAYRVKRDKGKVENYGPVDIPPGYFFVLGDNRLDTTDSRPGARSRWRASRASWRWSGYRSTRRASSARSASRCG
jgi:signal peptidase I